VPSGTSIPQRGDPSVSLRRTVGNGAPTGSWLPGNLGQLAAYIADTLAGLPSRPGQGRGTRCSDFGGASVAMALAAASLAFEGGSRSWFRLISTPHQQGPFDGPKNVAPKAYWSSAKPTSGICRDRRHQKKDPASAVSNQVIWGLGPVLGSNLKPDSIGAAQLPQTNSAARN